MSLVPNRAIEGAAGNQGYNIQRSLRFRSSASAYLNRTPASSANRQISTFSAWVKRGVLSSGFPEVFSAAPNGSTYKDALYFTNTDTLCVLINGGVSYQLITSQVFRDPSAWYHIILAIDTTQATAANRIKLYVNGSQVTAFGTANYPTQNYNPNFNSAIVHNIGRSTDANDYFDGYLAEVNFIDGQALTPSSFGQTDAVTGVWQPKKYTGTYGTNGFYLPFSDNTSATTLAYDKSGNGNNWTANNISTTAGATYDSMTDVPTLTSATAANYCVLNPLDNAGTAISGSANLNAYTANCSGRLCGTQAVSSGKYYWEAAFTGNDTGQTAMFGICQDYNTAQAYVTYGYYATGSKYSFASGSSAYGASWTNNDIIGVALDMDAGTIAFYKNGVAQGTAFTGLTGGWKPAFSSDYGTSGRGIIFWANFGQRPFSYTPPTGFKALNTFNLPDPVIKKPNQYMDVSTWSGDNTTPKAVVSNLAFQPDFLWLKQRSTVNYHFLQNSITGATNYLASNATDAESSGSSGGWVQSFDSNGYTTVTGSSNSNNVNGSGITYVGWSWKESATAGFDIVTYTGTGSPSAVIPHNLGIAPSFVIIKNRTTGGSDWNTFGSAFTRLKLNSTAADFGTYPITRGAASVTLPSIDDLAWSSSGNNYVMYLFAEIPGFSKFGSYTGNGSTDGPFVYCGFRPAFVMIKQTSSAGNDWVIRDNKRASSYNEINADLFPNTSTAETSDIYRVTDFTSNGFKIRNTGSGSNSSGSTYIYAAFAENPFKYSNAR